MLVRVNFLGGPLGGSVLEFDTVCQSPPVMLFTDLTHQEHVHRYLLQSSEYRPERGRSDFYQWERPAVHVEPFLR